MAEVDRDLPFSRPASPDKEPKTLVGLVNAILTKPSMVVSALLLMNPVLLLIAVLFAEPMAVAILASANLTLFVWALLRDRAKRKAKDFGGEEGPGPYPTTKG